LEFLEIDHFIIEAFPDINTPHRHLKKLVLNYNKLKALPAGIANLTVLETLQSSNPLMALPGSFATLKNMKELGLYNTEFTTFPAVLFALNKLSLLYISGPIKGNTKIKELPDSFQELPQLTELGISNAALSMLPASIGQLKQLNKADFSNNLFTEFPSALEKSMHLEFVSFSSNPLKWSDFLASVKKIKWHGLFFLHETGLNKQQYETVQQILNKTDVYYDGMND
jgi:Leucine-rich repeat (LRR) protein